MPYLSAKQPKVSPKQAKPIVKLYKKPVEEPEAEENEYIEDTPESHKRKMTISEIFDAVDFAPENIIAEVAKNSVIFGDVIQLRYDTLMEVADAKADLERNDAECDMILRDEARQRDEKITEKALAVLVSVDPKVVAAKRRLAKAEATDKYVSLMVDLLKMRRDCLEMTTNLVRNELGVQAAFEANAGKLRSHRDAIRRRFQESDED